MCFKEACRARKARGLILEKRAMQSRNRKGQVSLRKDSKPKWEAGKGLNAKEGRQGNSCECWSRMRSFQNRRFKGSRKKEIKIKKKANQE